MKSTKAILILLSGVVLGAGGAFFLTRPHVPPSQVPASREDRAGSPKNDDSESAGPSLIGRRGTGADAGRSNTGGPPTAKAKGDSGEAVGTAPPSLSSNPVSGVADNAGTDRKNSAALSSGGGTPGGGTVSSTAIPSGPVGAAASSAEQALMNAATAGSGIELKIDVPFGAKVPAVVLDTAEERPAPQQAALAEILADFSEDVAGITPDSPDATRIWEQARLRADERYRILFGDDAFNALTMKAAVEALQEKDSTSAKTGP